MAIHQPLLALVAPSSARLSLLNILKPEFLLKPTTSALGLGKKNPGLCKNLPVSEPSSDSWCYFARENRQRKENLHVFLPYNTFLCWLGIIDWCEIWSLYLAATQGRERLRPQFTHLCIFNTQFVSVWLFQLLKKAWDFYFPNPTIQLVTQGGSEVSVVTMATTLSTHYLSDIPHCQYIYWANSSFSGTLVILPLAKALVARLLSVHCKHSLPQRNGLCDTGTEYSIGATGGLRGTHHTWGRGGGGGAAFKVIQ